MKKYLIAVAILMLSATAQAQVNIGGTQANSEAEAHQTSKLVNAPSTVIEAAPIPTTTTLRNTPGFAMSGPASGPCNGASGGLTLVGPGIGGGVNASVESANCNGRETSRVASSNAMVASQLGDEQMKKTFLMMAYDALANTPYWQDVMAKKAEQAQAKKTAAAPAPQVVAAADPSCVTDEFIARRLNKRVCGQ